jgi:cytochrome c5
LTSGRTIQSRARSLLTSALFLSALGLAVLAALSAHLSAQSPAPAPPPAQAPTQPPGAVNLDAIGAKKLPDAPGREIVLTSCKDCHTFDRITMAHHSAARWRVIVREMEQRGANVDPGDVDPLVQYLATNFGLRHSVAKSASPPPSHPPSP